MRDFGVVCFLSFGEYIKGMYSLWLNKFLTITFSSVNHLQKELQGLKDAKDQQIQEMKRNHEDVLLKKQNNHEKKVTYIM